MFVFAEGSVGVDGLRCLFGGFAAEESSAGRRVVNDRTIGDALRCFRWPPVFAFSAVPSPVETGPFGWPFAAPSDMFQLGGWPCVGLDFARLGQSRRRRRRDDGHGRGPVEGPRLPWRPRLCRQLRVGRSRSWRPSYGRTGASALYPREMTTQWCLPRL